jgi:hypothetical protein
VILAAPIALAAAIKRRIAKLPFLLILLRALGAMHT